MPQGRDTDLVTALERDGFAVTPFLGPEVVAELLDVFTTLGLDDEPWYTTTGHAPRPVARRIDRLVRDAVADAVSRALPGFTPFTGAFISKASTEQSTVFLHQDWTYVDETRARAFIAWCPLIDVGVREGTLHVVPGSHRWTHLTRGSHFPPVYEDVEQLLIDDHTVPVPVVAGTAVVYDSALLHYSPPNRSGAVRPVVAVGLAPVDAPLVHHFADADGLATIYEVDDRFFTEQENGRQPQGCRMLGRYRVSGRRFTPDDIARLATAPGGGATRG